MKKRTRIAAALLALLMCTALLPTDASADCTEHSLYQAEYGLQTCTTDGYYVLRCRNCSYSEYVVTGTATGHSWNLVYENPASCTADAQQFYECGNCEMQDTRTLYGTATGHHFGEWMVITPATCTQEGIRARECDCGFTERAAISPTGVHSFGEWMVITPATCTQEGIRARECDCGFTERAAIFPTGVHSFGAWMVITPATCTQEGIRARECDCGHVERTAIPMADHAWNAGTVTVPPTTTAEGFREYVCATCGRKSLESIPMLPAGSGATTLPEATIAPADPVLPAWVLYLIVGGSAGIAAATLFTAFPA